MRVSPAVVCHGGAGHGAEDQPGVDLAADVAWNILSKGGASLDAVLAAVVSMEDDSNLNAGTGGRIKLDGSVQLDAAVATSDGKLGCVMAIEQIRNPILVAADILDEEFNILAGRGATEYASSKGYNLQEVIGSHRNADTDTVGAIARDSNGIIAIATSTGGCSNRPAGRVGDTPLWGPGLWCDSKIGVAATGIGEAITMNMLCYRVADKHKKSDSPNLQSSLEWGLSLFDSDTEVGLIALDNQRCGIGLSNTNMPWAKRS